MNESIISINSLTKKYNDVIALNNVSLEIPKTILVYPFQFDHIPKQTITAKITQIGTTITATIKLAVKEWVNEGFKKSVR